MQFAITLLIGLMMLIASMIFAWVLVRRTGNGGLTDVVWTIALGVTGLYLCYAVAPLHERSLIAALFTAIWTIRLATPLWRRNVGGPEDARYAAFRHQWGDNYASKLFELLMIQAFAALPLALTIMLAAYNPMPLGFMDFLGILIMVAALSGGYIADIQLARFKKNPSNRGHICDVGLWSRSRHPNYFFEAMFWSGWFFLAVSGGWLTGLLAMIGPVFMYGLLRFVSGEPMVEKHMAQHYGEAFTLYCDRVPPFFPRLFSK